jgi:hypothetical protein
VFLLSRSRCDYLHRDFLNERRHVLCKTAHDGDKTTAYPTLLRTLFRPNGENSFFTRKLDKARECRILEAMNALRLGLSIATLLWTMQTLGQSFQSASPVRLPARLESYLTNVVHATPSERKLLLDGSPITEFLNVDPSREVSVFGAIWINASPHRYVDAVKDIENFERGETFMITKRISVPPKVDDFADWQLPKEDFTDLRTCRVGNCELKLSRQTIEKLRAEVDWTKPTAKAAVEDVLRQLAYGYVTGYLENGNSGLAVYLDSSKPTVVATEFESMIDRMPTLTEYQPELRRYLLDFPKTTLPDSTNFLYWQVTQFGLKPTMRISHLVIRERAEETVVASKMLYASHYFWTALELRVLVSDPSRGAGFWFVTINSSRSDGLSGLFGRLIRSHIRQEVQKGVLAYLTETKKKLEQQAR